MFRIAPLAIVLLVPASDALAGFEGFESIGFPPERPGGALPEGESAPSVKAFRVTGYDIRVDGRLDDAPWKLAEPAGGFLRFHPERGRWPTEETLFKVAYDDEALYFAVACLERDAANIARSLSRRDQLRDSDFVSIYIDPYLDRTTGYNFRVNPLGVQEDHYMFNDGDRDRDWDAVWDVETHVDDDGWYAELRVPFSSIRYRPQGSMTWGLQVYRYMQRRGEDTGWAVWDQESRGFISRFGTLTDLEGVPNPRQLEVVPYFVQRTTNPVPEDTPDEPDHFQNFGADLKYGLTADLTLNATFQPDFGQVEADPAVLNLSPFETFFDERRPFFIEGSRFYQQKGFNLFYSRRIGTGDESSRIRAAAKLTGKVSGDLSVAALYAATDVTGSGQAHNFLKSGSRLAHFAVTRLGKDFADGNHSVHLMQTAVVRTAERLTESDDDHASRNGYTTGFDFDLNFADRKFNVEGAFVGTVVDPKEVVGDPAVPHALQHGTGGALEAGKYDGSIRGNFWGRWESLRLDPNDLGFLSAPNEMGSGAWVGWRYSQPAESPRLNEANLNFNFWKHWLFAPARVVSEDTGQVLWEYGRGHRQSAGGNVNGYVQFRNYHGAWFGLRRAATRTDQFITRGGPLMTRPSEWGGWMGVSTDWRKPLRFELAFDWATDSEDGYYWEIAVESSWDASQRVRFAPAIEFWRRNERADYLDTIDRGDPALGIGGESYVFGDIDQKTLELTMRSNVLFNRDQSLELYFQPFVTVGDYRNARELTRANSYALEPYAVDGFRAEDFDFSFAAVNVNVVYRFEYRPGSTLFLVWTHSRSEFRERSGLTGAGPFQNDISTGDLFSTEPENTVLAKLTYWFSL